ncbi:MAG TPA: deoxyribonuclease IV [Pyrodictium sp.]|nr:deoxyribonuclease IV [Pyrodictium sp.]
MGRRMHFGPAGKPVGMKQGDYVKAIEYISGLGLDAIEYEAVRGVRVSEAKARAIREVAERYNVIVSMHAPYYINLAGSEETIKKSIERLKAALRAAGWMGAYVVVFHPGYYRDNPSPRDAVRKVVESLRPVVEWMKQEGIRDVWLSPETTGKSSQVGSLDDVIEICRELEMCRPTVDWAHLHARSEGNYITSLDHVIDVIERIEQELGTWAVKPLHTHFSRIEYGRGGEREHHTLAEEEYGPEWRIVCRAYRETEIEGVVISESPILDRDALVMKKICEEEGYI